jgi:hypothetical protein
MTPVVGSFTHFKYSWSLRTRIVVNNYIYVYALVFLLP